MLRAELSDKFEEEMQEKYELNNKIRNIIKHSGTSQIPLEIQIEYNLTNGRGYDGIKLPRDKNNETEENYERVLLAMDRLEGKIKPIKAQFKDENLRLKECVAKYSQKLVSQYMYSMS